MSDKVEQMFSNLRRGPWNADPTGIPQEGFGGNGNIESQGWLSDGSVTADVIQANAVIAGKIDADAVTAREIAANTITANEIAANTITAAQIAANTITASEIAANTITASEIAANAITASELAANSVVSGKIAADTITATEIAANAITASELAADSVITAKIAAGNVTSSRIELTLSGKNFGANDGSTAQPGIFFDSDSDTGMSRWGVNQIEIATGGNTTWVWGGGENISYLPVMAGVSTLDLGSSGLRWDVVYCVTLNQSSDAKLKRDIKDAPLGLDFVRSLRPRVFRWRESADTQQRQEANAQFDREAMARECRPHEQRIRATREAQVSGAIDDAEAEQIVADERRAISEIAARHQKAVRSAQGATRPGRRLHYGLIAQEVKEALDAAGVDPKDAAFWTESPEGEQSLSYIEMTIPALRAIQELAVEVDRLRDLVEKDKDAKG